MPLQKDAGLPDTNRRAPHKPGESPALRRSRKGVREGRESGGLHAGSKVGGEGLVMLEIPGIDGLGFAFGGAGQEQ